MIDEPSVSEDIHKSVARLVLDYAKVDYTDVCATWRDIQGKAQGTVAIAGIFIGGSGVLLPRLSHAPCWVSAALAGVILLCVAAVLCAVVALRVGTYPALKDTQDVLRNAEQVLASADDARARTAIRDFVRTIAKDIAETNVGIHKINEERATWIGRAQLCLLVGVVVIGGLMVVSLFADMGL